MQRAGIFFVGVTVLSLVVFVFVLSFVGSPIPIKGKSGQLCYKWDFSKGQCSSPAFPRDNPPVCGNGIQEAPEVCDGEDLAGVSCDQIEPFNAGILSCASNCLSFNTDWCVIEDYPVCGNTLCEAPENAESCPLDCA